MSDIDYVELQRRHGGRYVARRGDRVILSADTYNGLSDQLKKVTEDPKDLIIEYVEPADSVRAY
jgi:hypothetical protein